MSRVVWEFGECSYGFVAEEYELKSRSWIAGPIKAGPRLLCGVILHVVKPLHAIHVLLAYHSY